MGFYMLRTCLISSLTVIGVALPACATSDAGQVDESAQMDTYSALEYDLAEFVDRNRWLRRLGEQCRDFDYSSLPQLKERLDAPVSTVSLFVDENLQDGGVEFFPLAGNMGLFYALKGIRFAVVADRDQADFEILHVDQFSDLSDGTSELVVSAPYCRSVRTNSGELRVELLSSLANDPDYPRARAQCLGEAFWSSTGFSFGIGERDVYEVRVVGSAPRSVLVQYQGATIGLRTDDRLTCTSGFNGFAIEQGLSPWELIEFLADVSSDR